ncbi:MAG: alanine dehydrogenase [Flavobacteriaceae bacterium]|nr:alanine dehydrogenase [Flavobacteriaceae bacterium]NVJ72927.1 alanine dehydrogenase [Flavobacteriaceae bacterium]
MTFGVLKERKNPPDKRVVLTPKACKTILDKYDAKIIVEPSDLRVFKESQYQMNGLEISSELDSCDVLFGVKEVPIEALIPDKKYFFFSHTIKKQPYNRGLLQAILKNKIVLYDHETIVDKKSRRLVAFGRFAGLVGAYNGLRTYGLKHQLFELPKAEYLEDLNELMTVLNDLKLPAMKIVLTGKGRVGNGAVEILDAVGIKSVGVDEFLNKEFDEAVYCQIDVADYNLRNDGKEFLKKDFFDNPQEYSGNFYRFAKVSDLYIAGHFYGVGAPYLLTRSDVARDDFNISVVADISCDIDGPVATTIRPSTIEDPIYGLDPITFEEVDYMDSNAVAVMAVDNLPCELPKDASESFSEAFVRYVIPAFYNNDADGVLARAQMTTSEGTLTDRFKYLQDYVNGN